MKNGGVHIGKFPVEGGLNKKINYQQLSILLLEINGRTEVLTCFPKISFQWRVLSWENQSGKRKWWTIYQKMRWGNGRVPNMDWYAWLVRKQSKNDLQRTSSKSGQRVDSVCTCKKKTMCINTTNMGFGFTWIAWLITDNYSENCFEAWHLQSLEEKKHTISKTTPTRIFSRSGWNQFGHPSRHLHIIFLLRAEGRGSRANPHRFRPGATPKPKRRCFPPVYLDRSVHPSTYPSTVSIYPSPSPSRIKSLYLHLGLPCWTFHVWDPCSRPRYEIEVAHQNPLGLGHLAMASWLSHAEYQTWINKPQTAV